MGQEERPADKRQYLLIGYVGICVVLVCLTLVLALTPDDSAAVGQPTLRATATRNPIVLTAQADYATVAPTPTRSGS